VLPKNTPYTFDLAIPTDPLTEGRYLICSSHFGWEIDPALIDEGLCSDDFLPILTGCAVSESKKFDQFLGQAIKKLLSFLELFETEILADYLELIASLIAHNPHQFQYLHEFFIELLGIHIHECRVAVQIIEMISLLANVTELFSPIFENSLPFICEALRYPKSRETGVDFLAAMVCEHETLTIHSEVFEMFINTLRLGIFNDIFCQTAFQLIAFFSRNGFASVLLPLWWMDRK
jgi:hypothetical protein